MIKWHTEKRKIAELKEWEDNPRKPISDKEYENLKKSITKRGFHDILKIDENNVVLSGNQRLKALKELGYTEVECKVSDKVLTQDQKDAVALESNTHGGEWDMDKLADGFGDVMEEIGFGDLMPEVELDVKEDDYEEPEDLEVRVKLGEVWQLGKHRLMCGDSTKREDVEKLMNGQKADIGFTSPPYNAGKTPTEVKMGKYSKYANDSDNREDSEYFNLLRNSTELSNKFTEYNFINLQLLSGNKLPLLDFVYYNKDRLADIIIWNKLSSQPAMAENVLNSQFEFVFVLSDKGNRHIGTRHFRGTLSNVVDISKQNNNEVKEHNATFPVEFAGHFVKNFSTESVLDLFGGSGSTLIACEQTNRVCYMMELDEHYCTVILDRWEKLTGEKAIKLED